jgi:hypothetical protein
MDELTSAERRLVLSALWAYRFEVAVKLERARRIQGAEGTEMHEIETIDGLDSAARKLSGDPQKKYYNASAF